MSENSIPINNRPPLSKAQNKAYKYFCRRPDAWQENYNTSTNKFGSTPLFSYSVLTQLVAKGYLEKHTGKLNAYERQLYKVIL